MVSTNSTGWPESGAIATENLRVTKKKCYITVYNELTMDLKQQATYNRYFGKVKSVTVLSQVGNGSKSSR